MIKALTGKARAGGYTALIACVGVLALAFAAPSADALFEGQLPGYTQTESGYEVAGMTYMYGGTGGGSMCIGPSRYNGKIYFPDGYQCGNPVGWGFPEITAHIGVYNPNSYRISFAVEPT